MRQGPKCYPFGRRYHHGLFGLQVAAVGVAFRARVLVLIGLALVLDDLHDFPWWPSRRSG